MAQWDVIVTGAGAMGSAGAYHLARRGARVLALEQFELGHERGSSHGITRIIRHAYYNHPNYVPLVKRAQTLWGELETTCGKTLFVQSGGVSLGRPDAPVVRGALAAALKHNLVHEVLDAAEVRHRFPAVHVSGDMIGVFDPSAGFLLAERSIFAHVAAARLHGAEVLTGQQVTGWTTTRDGVEVQTKDGIHRAEKLVLTAGAWTSDLVSDLNLPLEVTRQVLGWFETNDPAPHKPERLPIWLLQPPGDRGYYYGFPQLGLAGIKIGRMPHLQTPVMPDTLDRKTNAKDEATLRQCLSSYLPGANGRALDLKTCLFTNTPDGHFIIDQHPQHANVTIVSACSGHGFKFASVMGEITADLALEGATRHSIGMFRLDRFDKTLRA